jgi:hypothetical protein
MAIDGCVNPVLSFRPKSEQLESSQFISLRLNGEMRTRLPSERARPNITGVSHDSGVRHAASIDPVHDDPSDTAGCAQVDEYRLGAPGHRRRFPHCAAKERPLASNDDGWRCWQLIHLKPPVCVGLAPASRQAVDQQFNARCDDPLGRSAANAGYEVPLIGAPVNRSRLRGFDWQP